jgi:hypothetical protein
VSPPFPSRREQHLVASVFSGGYTTLLLLLPLSRFFWHNSVPQGLRGATRRRLHIYHARALGFTVILYNFDALKPPSHLCCTIGDGGYFDQAITVVY